LLRTDTKAFPTAFLADDTERAVFCDGTDQYIGDGTGNGASACGLAAQNCARVVLSIEQGSLHDAAFL